MKLDWPSAPQMLAPPVAIGNTPWLRLGVVLNGMAHEVAVKEEFKNAFGSIKDRVAWALFREAIEKGLLNRGGRLIDASSGNYGIALASLGSMFGVAVEIVVSDGIPDATIGMIRKAGAFVHVAEAVGSETLHEARIALAGKISKDNGAIFINQYNNPGNPATHYSWTAPEIFAPGIPGALFVSASSGGTVAGVSRYIDDNRIGCAFFVVDSVASNILYAAEAPDKNLFVPGMGSKRPTSFVPPIDNYRLLRLQDTQALAYYHVLRRGGGLSLGLSSCGVFAGIVNWLGQQDQPRKVVMLGTDRHGKYEAHVEACLQDEELAKEIESYVERDAEFLKSIHGLWNQV